MNYVETGCGMGREATLYLLERGVRVTGTDAWGWDAPFVHTARKYAETGDATLIWEGHKAGREIGYCHLEKLHNLEALPAKGFTVTCFPVKVRGASAGWTRAVAIIDRNRIATQRSGSESAGMSTLSNSPYTPDLRGFIEFLEAEHPEQVVRITKEVDPKFGVSGILERLERDGRFPLVIFENVKGSKIPLVANMHASFERLRLALGMEHGGVKEFVSGMRRAPGPSDRSGHGRHRRRCRRSCASEPRWTSRSCRSAPITRRTPASTSPPGLAVMRDPETGINNVGIYRHMVHEKNLLGVQLSETADGNIIWKKYEKRGLPCPVAIVIGHHPAFFIGSLCFSTLDSDEIRIAGGMLQRPVPLVRCKTIPLEVPADAEIVLECEIRPRRATRRGAVRRVSRHLWSAPDESRCSRSRRSPGGAIRSIRMRSSAIPTICCCRG